MTDKVEEKKPVIRIDKDDGPPILVWDEDMEKEKVADLTRSIQERVAMNNIIKSVSENENKVLTNINVFIQEFVRLLFNSLAQNNQSLLNNLSVELEQALQSGEKDESIQDKKEGEKEAS
jgi:flagellar biosynthesis chaperone FliJ